MGAGGGRDLGQKDKDVSAVSWFEGLRVSACMQGKDRTAHACAAGAGPWVGHAAEPGRCSKVWASRGRARLYLLIWALYNRFALMGTNPHGSGNTVCIHPARAWVRERWRRGLGADHVRVGMRAEGRSGVSAWGGEACVHGDECVRVGGVRAASCMWGKRACVCAWQA